MAGQAARKHPIKPPYHSDEDEDEDHSDKDKEMPSPMKKPARLVWNISFNKKWVHFSNFGECILLTLINKLSKNHKSHHQKEKQSINEMFLMKNFKIY